MVKSAAHLKEHRNGKQTTLNGKTNKARQDALNRVAALSMRQRGGESIQRMNDLPLLVEVANCLFPSQFLQFIDRKSYLGVCVDGGAVTFKGECRCGVCVCVCCRCLCLDMRCVCVCVYLWLSVSVYVRVHVRVYAVCVCGVYVRACSVCIVRVKLT